MMLDRGEFVPNNSRDAQAMTQVKLEALTTADLVERYVATRALETRWKAHSSVAKTNSALP